MQYNPSNPLIVQGDGTVLLEVHNPLYEEVRDQLSRFAELEKSPEHIHTYRITPLSIWNAAAAGLTLGDIRHTFEGYSKYDVPSHVMGDIEDYLSRFGKIQLMPGDEDFLLLETTDGDVTRKLARSKVVSQLTSGAVREGVFRVPRSNRGVVKQALLKMQYPVEDRAGFVDGAALDVRLRKRTLEGEPFELREYQTESVDTFYRDGQADGGHGVVVLPCGAGKTIVAMATMATTRCHTLILCTGIAAVRQWKRELLDKTHLIEEQIGEYSGEVKQVRPVTITTYQILTHRRPGSEKFLHLGLFDAGDWGLIVYDEVHLLPAPVFRITADIQARRRLGLTATLVREDGREGDVFSLIGPKRYDVPWKELECKGFIASARCCEVRLELTPESLMLYLSASDRHKARIAAENPAKLSVVLELLERHRGEHVLVIGMYLDQLKSIARRCNAPLITGKTANAVREALYRKFREGDIRVLVVSKVANFSIDLPDANVAIQVSGTFGSRQEEAQRLGRILRPKSAFASFYSVVSRNTREQEFAHKRQLFLTEQGYSYFIEEWDEEAGGISPIDLASITI
jgi:DNA excision repair protein ERCC-3